MRLAVRWADRFIDRLVELGGLLSAGIIVFMSLSIIWEIFSRVFLSVGTKWVLDFTVYGLVALTFLGAASVEKRNANICIDIISSGLSEGIKKVLEVIVYIISAVFLILFLEAFIKYLVDAYVSKRLSMSIMRTPMWIPYSFIVIGNFILLLQFLRKAVLHVRELITLIQEKKFEHNQEQIVSIIKVIIILSLIIVGFILFNFSGSLRIIGFIMMLFGLLFSGMPIFIAFFIIGYVGFTILSGFKIAEFQITSLAYGSLASFMLTALPLFVFAGYLFAASGVVNKLFTLCEVWLNRLPGSLAMATVASCAIFSAISGSSVATAASIGVVAIPAMIKRGYDPALACGAVAAAGTLGSMIPPSNQFILYALLTDTSLGKLFIAGIIPGIFIALMFMTYIYFKCKNDPRYMKKTDYSFKDKLIYTKESFPILLAPVIILGGIYTGIFTPTESAAIAVIYGFVLCIATKQISLKNFSSVLTNAALTSTMILLIVAGASTFGGLVTLLQIAQNFTDWAISSALPYWGVIVVIMLLGLVLGAFMDGIALTMIVVPIVFTTVMAMGFDPIWFGVLFALNIEMGLVTPPVGMTLFTVKGISNIEFGTIVRGSMPFLLVMLFCLAIVGLFEPISLWLPSLMK